MIRDPSDGSVREKPAIGIPITEKPVIETGTSGLQTGSTKPEYQARLEKSPATVSKNIRRTGIPASKAGKPNPAYPSIEIHGCPTAERLRMAGPDFALGGEDRGVKTYVMRDSPLDRAHKKGIINGAEHSALQLYRHHWYHAGQAPTISSLDLNRIFSGGDGGPAGMPKSEGQVYHRQRWREAQTCLGMRSSAIVDRFVCQEENLELCGQAIGWNSKPQAIAGAAELVKDAGYRLARLWGIG